MPTQLAERSSSGPALPLLDRLFAPHGFRAYARWLPGGPASVPIEGDVAPAHGRTDFAEPGGDPAVRLARSGAPITADGTLLESLEAAGVAVPNRCRRGICGTCTTPKLAGTTRDIRTGETSTAVGPIRVCVTEACDQVTLDL